MTSKQTHRLKSHRIITSKLQEKSPRSNAFEQTKADLYWVELSLRLYFIWCTACVASINTIFLVNIYVDFVLQWEEIHSSLLDWIPFTIDSLSFVYLFFQLLGLNFHFMSWAAYHTILDELTLSHIINELKRKNEFNTGKISNSTIIQVISNIIGSTSFRARLPLSVSSSYNLFEAPMMTILFNRIAYVSKYMYPNISVATLIRFIALIIASFVGVLNVAIMEQDINDTTFLYAFSKISLWLGVMLFVAYIVINSMKFASKMKKHYAKSTFDLELLLQSLLDYNKWQTAEIIIGVFGLFVVVSMFFNGYSFYFVLLAFIMYALSYLIWKYKSSKHTFLSLFSSVPTAFALKTATSKICCTCIGFGIILLPLILTFLTSSSKSIYDLSNIKQHSHLYPICSSDWGTLTISDLSYLSALAYHANNKETIIAGLDIYFDKKTLILNKDGSVHNDIALIYIAGQLDKEPIFYHLKDTSSDSHYIVIRGSATMKDFIEDLQLYSEIGVIQLVSHIFPLLYIWPTQMIVDLISFCSIIENYWLSPGHDNHYFKGVETYIDTIISAGIVADNNVYIIGHSLGGGVAQIIGGRYYENHNCDNHDDDDDDDDEIEIENNNINYNLQPFEVHSIGFNSPGTFYSSKKFGFKPTSLDYTSTSVLANRDIIGAIDKHGGVIQTIDCEEKTWLRCHSALHTFCKLYYGCYSHDHHHHQKTSKESSHKELFVYCLCSKNGISEKECQTEFGEYMPKVHDALDGEFSFIS